MKEPFSLTRVEKDIKQTAKGLGIPSGAAEIFATKAARAAHQSLQSKSIITDHDLHLALAKELTKYNADLAYVYRNRDTII